jgi:hypothetical protein
MKNISSSRLKFINLIINQCSLRTFTNVLKTFPKAGCILNFDLCNDKDTVFSYIIPPSLCMNNYKSNQFTVSGAMAVLDELSTYSLMLKDKNCRSGVSVHFNVKIHNTCKANDSVIIISKSDKIGKTLGFCSMNIYSNDNERKLLVSGNHIKFLPGGGMLFDFLTSKNILPFGLKLIELIGSEILDHIFAKKLLENQKSENIKIREAFDNLEITVSDSNYCQMNSNRINDNILGITHGIPRNIIYLPYYYLSLFSTLLYYL